MSVQSNNLHLELHGHLGDDSIDIVTADPSLVEAIGRFDTPQDGTVNVLQTGARVILAAAAGFDLQSIRYEIERAVGDGGPLAAALLRQADDGVPGSFVSRVQDITAKIEVALGDARTAIARELNGICERQTEALGRTVRDFRELDPASGVGAALTRIETMLREQNALLAASRAVTAEYQRGSAKGLDYEELVARSVADVAAIHGDRAERSGTEVGVRRGDKRLAKRGDVTVFVGDDPMLVIEAKDSARITGAAIQRELDEALQNRGARAALAVISENRGTLMCGQPLVQLRPDMWAVHLPKDLSDSLPLRVAYLLARQVALAKATDCGSADLDEIRARAEEIMRRLTALTEIRQHIANSMGSQEKASTALITFERELRASVFSLIDSVNGQSMQAA